MLSGSIRDSGWRGIGLVAITYVYFLIFAQFAFLKRLAELGIEDAHLKLVMAAMAIGGILCSLAVGYRLHTAPPGRLLRIALLVCSASAAATIQHLTLAITVLISFAIGCGLGLLTVTLVTHLPQWLGDSNHLFRVALGTGLGYFAVNIPWLFNATPRNQALASTALCLVGFMLVSTKPTTSMETAEDQQHRRYPISFARVLLAFTTLVWLDSAAFFIVQNTPALKAGTWGGPLHLWSNGLLHLAAAIACVGLLRRYGLAATLGTAVTFFAIACILLWRPGSIIAASVFYPIAVAIYSVALVAYPALLAAPSTSAERARRAGWIYAIAGWIGSAMGIGMGQNLGHVPLLFIAAASAFILLPNLFVQLQGRRYA